MSEKPRYIGLDIGDKRIGVAISDPLGYTAAGLETITRINTDKDVRLVQEIAARHGAVLLVLGLPLNMDGTSGPQAEKVKSFGRKLARATELPVIYEDERLSTISAIRTLTLQGVKTGKNRELVDRQAAAIILQRFLDRGEDLPSA
ncbi:MAG: Holliday junction resolvase RuvX [Candidatus Obscuribacterales bacterium]|jgi:putative Holliday junction resolvase|nr:Holliday junction resolvase RuvX [Candidatus Obscuribacterales bacterium]